MLAGCGNRRAGSVVNFPDWLRGESRFGLLFSTWVLDGRGAIRRLPGTGLTRLGDKFSDLTVSEKLD